MLIRIGIPDSTGGVYTRTAVELGAPTMISVNSMRRGGAFSKIGPAAWCTDAALDSAGFVAMKKGGYAFTLDEYVDFVVTNGGNCEMPFPWAFWSSMDYCCEPEIASSPQEVRARVDKTTETLADILALVDDWRDEGDTTTPDPMPIVQGWRPVDYVESWWQITSALEAAGRGHPTLLGVGSVCRRSVYGDNGLLYVVGTLHALLPPEVKLHLFGVKGSALALLRGFGDRIYSVDSMAWSFAARRQMPNQSRTREKCAQYMREWYLAQVEER